VKPHILPVAALLLSAGAVAAGEKPYDDRAAIKQAIQDADLITKLMPMPADAGKSKTTPFEVRRLPERIASLRGIRKRALAAAKAQQHSVAVNAHRTDMAAAIARLVSAYDAYFEAFELIAKRKTELKALKKAEPPLADAAKHKQWLRRYKSLVARREVKGKMAVQSKHAAQDAGRAAVDLFRKIAPEVDSLYEQGTAAPFDPSAAGAPAASEKTAEGGALVGTPAELIARSACTPREFRDAVKEKNWQYFEVLTGKLIIWRTMLVEPPKASDKAVTAKLMAGGGTFAAEFPPKSEAASLKPGASLVVAAEARRSGGERILRVMQWRLRKELDAGQPMNLCEWPAPEPAAESKLDAPDE